MRGRGGLRRIPRISLGVFYWCSNLPYFPSLFYFTAANALFLFGHRYDALQTSQPYFIIFSMIALAIAAGSISSG